MFLETKYTHARYIFEVIVHNLVFIKATCRMLLFVSLAGCVYKGAVYRQGQTWQEGCQFTCECVDETTGFYRCTDV